MLENTLAVQTPFGISVFGSAMLTASPDSAQVTAAVTRLEPKPADAFAKAKAGALAVTGFLRASGVEEFGASRISLTEQRRFFPDGGLRSLGYQAMVGFSVVIRKLDRLEPIVTGVIEAGADNISAISFQTSDLRELRTRARHLAVEAAREKAVTYARAARVELGKVIHIQDVNPQILYQPIFHAGQSQRGAAVGPDASDAEIDTTRGGLDPGAIEVRAAVVLAFGIGNPQP